MFVKLKTILPVKSWYFCFEDLSKDYDWFRVVVHCTRYQHWCHAILRKWLNASANNVFA